MAMGRMRAAIFGVLLVALFAGCSSQQDIGPDLGMEPGGTGETDAFAEEGIVPGGSLDRFQRGDSGVADGQSAGGGGLGDIQYEYDSFEIAESDKETLRVNAEWMRRNQAARVQLEGHCDERGTDEYNLALGAKRARAAKKYLVALGILPARLSVISYGEELPVCYDHDEPCWRKNRRVHFVVRRE